MPSKKMSGPRHEGNLAQILEFKTVRLKTHKRHSALIRNDGPDLWVEVYNTNKQKPERINNYVFINRRPRGSIALSKREKYIKYLRTASAMQHFFFENEKKKKEIKPYNQHRVN